MGSFGALAAIVVGRAQIRSRQVQMCTGHCSVMMKKDYSYLEALHAAEVYLAYYTNRQSKLTQLLLSDLIHDQ